MHDPAAGSLDVVTVPDFEGPNRARFEARALLFLGCWSEFGGAARQLPLHMACIGEPPASVRWLADRCEVRIHVFPPIATTGWKGLNKLRGLEIQTPADQLLLVDTDLLVLADFSEIGQFGGGLAAAPAVMARVPDRDWATIYRQLDVPVPVERLASTVGQLNAGYPMPPAYPEQHAESRSMLPYYNGGVVLVPARVELRPLWEQYVGRISALFDRANGYRAIAASDQAGLALAIVALERQGVSFMSLPARFNAGWVHLYRRAPTLKDVALFHAVGLFGRTHQGGRSVPYNVDRYCCQLAHRLATTWRRDPEGPLRPRTLRKHLAPALSDVRRLRRKLQHVCRTHVQPALQAGKQ